MGKMYLQKLTDLVEKELDTLTAKGTLNPTELDSAKKAVELLTKIEEYSMMCEEKENPEAMYSGRSYRSYGRSYAMPPEYYDPSMPMRSGNYMPGMGSMNRGSYGSGNWTANGQYSGHSIKDRMIDRLERMMDDAKTDYERQEIKNEIMRIRQEG